MYKFKLPIGDWSNDGHGKCNYYLLSSNKPVEEVREIHFKIKEVTGIDLHKICNQYDQSILYDLDIIQKIVDTGFIPEDVENVGGVGAIDEDDGIWIQEYEMAELWMHLLMCVDKELKLSIVDEKEVPMLPFYGIDEQKRHIGFVGYGLFD